MSLQASATRNEDEQFFGSQQALLQQQLADLRLKADQFRAEGHEASNGLRKKRLKLQQDLEVCLCTGRYGHWFDLTCESDAVHSSFICSQSGTSHQPVLTWFLITSSGTAQHCATRIQLKLLVS